VNRIVVRATVVCLAAATCWLALPGEVLAQRRAVSRSRSTVTVVRPRTVVRVGAGYGRAFYDPWYSPYGYWHSPYGVYYPGYYGRYYGGVYDLSSSLRLQVKPRETQVFVDGYYAGTVDDFDGIFQRLNAEPGEHDLELFLPGHLSYSQQLYLQPGRSMSLEHTMEPLAPGAPEPVPPAPASAPPPAARDRAPGAPQAPITEREPVPTDRALAEPSFGALSVRVQPAGATVTIDGEPWESSDESERLVVQLDEGTHAVEVRRDGYRTYVTEVDVRGGETATLNVSLAPN
jgi:hypothetical protein